MRLFLAADLDATARAAVAAAVGRLRERAEQERRGSTRGVTWVRPEHLHLTLHFLGEVDEESLPELRAALAAPLELDVPRMALGGWGTFPPRGPARVVWMGVTSGADALAQAHAALGARLRRVGRVPESRPFSAHLTVGRVKTPSGLYWNRVCASVPAMGGGEWPLRACTLFQSRLSPAGPAYSALLTIPFAGGRADLPGGASEANHAE